jgi:hypothetical protein
MDDQVRKSAPNLVGDLFGNVSDLVRKEIQLLRAEMSEKATQAVTAVGMIVSGVVIVLVALIVLSMALVAALANAGLGAGWAALLVGVAYTILAFILIGKGVKDLKASNLAPERTADSLAKDASMVKETMS